MVTDTRTVDAGIVRDVIRWLGYVPQQVTRVTFLPDRITVDLITPTSAGLITWTETRWLE